MRRNPVVPERNSSLIPLDANLEVLSIGDMIKQQLQQSIKIIPFLHKSKAYGVITSRGLGRRRKQSLRADHWKEQPILRGHHAVDCWSFA